MTVSDASLDESGSNFAIVAATWCYWVSHVLRRRLTLQPDTFEQEPEDAEPETAPTRSLSEVETEINIFRKWNRDVPEELLEEYQKLRGK